MFVLTPSCWLSLRAVPLLCQHRTTYSLSRNRPCSCRNIVPRRLFGTWYTENALHYVPVHRFLLMNRGTHIDLLSQFGGRLPLFYVHRACRDVHGEWLITRAEAALPVRKEVVGTCWEMWTRFSLWLPILLMKPKWLVLCSYNRLVLFDLNMDFDNIINLNKCLKMHKN